MNTRQDDGFTLTEVLIALVLMVTAVMGVAGLATGAARAAHVSRTSASTLALAQQRMEELTSLTWAVNEAGEFHTDEWTDLAAEPHGDSGAGMSPSPLDALLASVGGFADYLSPSGVWVGNGASPPAGAAFVRRWSIERLAGTEDRSIAVRVFVTTVAQAQRGSAGASAAAGADSVLASIRTRTAR